MAADRLHVGAERPGINEWGDGNNENIASRNASESKKRHPKFDKIVASFEDTLCTADVQDQYEEKVSAL